MKKLFSILLVSFALSASITAHYISDEDFNESSEAKSDSDVSEVSPEDESSGNDEFDESDHENEDEDESSGHDRFDVSEREREDEVEKVNHQEPDYFTEKFEKFTMNFINDQSDLIKDSENTINELKSSRDDELKLLQSQMSRNESENIDNDATNNEILEKIINKWKEYAEKIEGVQLNLTAKLMNLTTENLNLTIVMAVDNVPSLEAHEFYKWVEFSDSSSQISQNAVKAGKDIDSEWLYVIRKVDNDRILYGKSVHSRHRKQGYVTDERWEIGIHDYEVLMANSYTWCKYDPLKVYKDMPICRVKQRHSTQPGTLLEDGTCRIGFNWEKLIVSTDVEMLIIGQNSCENE